jgi:hypothetical protein
VRLHVTVVRLLRGQSPEFIAIIGCQSRGCEWSPGCSSIAFGLLAVSDDKAFPSGPSLWKQPHSNSKALCILPSPSRSLVCLARLVHRIVRWFRSMSARLAACATDRSVRSSAARSSRRSFARSMGDGASGAPTRKLFTLALDFVSVSSTPFTGKWRLRCRPRGWPDKSLDTSGKSEIICFLAMLYSVSP